MTGGTSSAPLSLAAPTSTALRIAACSRRLVLLDVERDLQVADPLAQRPDDHQQAERREHGRTSPTRKPMTDAG